MVYIRARMASRIGRRRRSLAIQKAWIARVHSIALELMHLGMVNLDKARITDADAI